MKKKKKFELKWTFISRAEQSAFALSGALTLQQEKCVCVYLVRKNAEKFKSQKSYGDVAELGNGRNPLAMVFLAPHKQPLCRWKMMKFMITGMKVAHWQCIVFCSKERHKTRPHIIFYFFALIRLAVAYCYINNFMASWASRARI